MNKKTGYYFFVLLAIIIFSFAYILNNLKLNNEEIEEEKSLTSTSTNDNLISSETLNEEESDLQNELTQFNNTKYNFSLKYPKNFFDLGLLELPPSQRPVIAEQYFSNKNISSPLEMGNSDIWISVRISENNYSLEEWAQSTPTNPEGTNISQKREININGLPAIWQVEIFGAEGTEGGYSEAVYLQNNDYSFLIKGITVNKDTFDLYRDNFTNIINTFETKK